MPLDMVLASVGVEVLQLGDFSPQQLGIEVGGGAVIGGVIGFAAKKIAKIIAIIVGLELALFKFLETRGVLDVNWDRITNTTAKVGETVQEGGDAGASWVNSLLSTLPVGAGFTGGFLLGFKKG